MTIVIDLHPDVINLWCRTDMDCRCNFSWPDV